MAIKLKTGDLITLAKLGEFDVIVHGSNCFHTMGSGIAKRISAAFPEAYEADLLTKKGDITKIGTISTGVHRRNAPIWDLRQEVHIVNAYIQFRFGTDIQQVEYDAIESALLLVKEQFSGKEIGMNKLGSGLAGGDWKVIYPIIERVLGDEDVTIVKYGK